MHGSSWATRTISFLEGGGAAATLMRAHPWAATPLGSPESWPQPLRTLVGVMLGSRQPMFIAWGEQLTLLYNDAYAEILGRKHPQALARPFLEVWAEIRADLQPLVDQVLSGESVHMDDIALVMERHGFREETHFAFSYTPIRDNSGRVGGIFCPCVETTQQVFAERRIVAERERLEQLFQQAPGFMAMLRGPDHVFELVNAAYLQLVGHRDVAGKPAREALPEIEGQGFFELLDEVYRSGKAFRGNALKVGLQRTPGAAAEERFIDLVYQPVTDADGRVTAIFAEGSDVTERVQAEYALREREERLRLVIEAAKDHAIFTTDPQGGITSWSAGAQAIFGWSAEEAVGQPIGVIFTPEDRAASADALELHTARRQGFANDERWHLRKDGSRVFMNGSVHPLHDAGGSEVGFLKVARDETARRATFEAATRLVAIVSTTPDAVISFSGEDGRITSWNKGAERLFGYTSAEAVGAPVSLLVPRPDQLTASEDTTGVFRWVMEKGTIQVDSVRRRQDGTLVDVSIAAARMDAPDGRVLGVSAIFRDITERKQAEKALRESEARLRELNETLEARVEERTRERDRVWAVSQDLFGVADAQGRWLSINPAWAASLGWEPSDILGKTSEWLEHPDDRAATRAEIERLGAGEKTLAFENRFRHREGGFRWLSWTAAPESGLLYCVARDVTAEKEAAEALRQAEEQLRQAQKMEAVGQLTGGIAHDFNNLLAGIVGSLDLMQTRLQQGRTESIERYAKAAMSSAQRAAALTHRLLAFSRRQPLDPKPVNANQLVTSMEDLLRRTIGPLHALELVTAGGLWTTLCDPNQLESAILNLAINARDAMPEGGRLTIETANKYLDAAYAAAERDVKAGQYVAISVTDTGSGMAPDVVARAFEPFFTTKPLGQGTGLGLSMVYGFAKQSEGHIKIYSEVGKGTTIRVYLPRHLGAADEVERSGPAAEPLRAEAGETVLVVEDEPVVRALIVEVLQDLGYRALEAPDGVEGLRILLSRQHIDLLVTDVGLPGLNGRNLADHARERRPGLKVLFITGYAENATLANGFLDHGMEMITKPFAVDALAAKIRAIIREG